MTPAGASPCGHSPVEPLRSPNLSTLEVRLRQSAPAGRAETKRAVRAHPAGDETVRGLRPSRRRLLGLSNGVSDVSWATPASGRLGPPVRQMALPARDP